MYGVDMDCTGDTAGWAARAPLQYAVPQWL